MLLGWSGLMRRLVLLLGMAASGFSAHGAQRVSVQQLEGLLAQQQIAHKADEEVAQQLSSMELTERLTESRVSQLDAEFTPGSKTLAALDLLADLSAFLQPPSGELPRKDPPSPVEQQKIFDAATNFANVALKHMPDFLATRTTKSFEDVPVITSDSAFQSGLHSMGTFVRETAYRDGREVAENKPGAADAQTSPFDIRTGLTSIGEFGEDLGIIVSDSVKGKISWSHWEQTSAGIVAVFHYEVPKQASHFRIYFCCAWDSAANRDISYEGTPAYQGFLSISPSNGAILRATLEVEFDSFNPTPHYGVAVEYAQVDTDGHSSTLPIRSVAIGDSTTRAEKRFWINLFINEVSFSDYHRFGSTVRILSNPPTR
jgi:hypothetical protein